jgi:hypothetical protein
MTAPRAQGRILHSLYIQYTRFGFLKKERFCKIPSIFGNFMEIKQDIYFMDNGFWPEIHAGFSLSLTTSAESGIII